MLPSLIPPGSGQFISTKEKTNKANKQKKKRRGEKKQNFEFVSGGWFVAK